MPALRSFSSPQSQALFEAVVGLDVPATRQALKAGANALELDADLAPRGLLNCVLGACEEMREELHARAGTARQHAGGSSESGRAPDAIATDLQASLTGLSARVHGVVSAVLAKAPSLPLGVFHNGMLPSHLAAFMGLGSTFSLLVDKGMDPAAVSPYGRTAAHWAARGGHTGMLRRLSAWGVPLDKQDQGGATPAHLAAGEGLVLVMRELKRLGAQLDKKNTKGLTASDVLDAVDALQGREWRKWELRFESQKAAERLSSKLGSVEQPEASIASSRPKSRF